MKRWEIILVVVLVVFFAVGVAGHWIDSTRSLMIALTPGALLLTAAAAIVPLVAERRRGVLVWLGVSFVVGFAVEVAGVATGAIFGSYHYGPVLGPALLSVPLIIGLNWAIVVLGASSLVRKLTRCPLLIALLAGLLTAGFDWLLEPVAMALGYWQWQGGVIPLRNYIAWFTLSAVLSLGFGIAKLEVKSWVPAAVLGVEAVFFALLRIGPA